MLGAEVSEVSCSLATHSAERVVDERTGEVRRVTTDDEANLILRLEDTDLTAGTTATISLSVVEQGRHEHRLEIFGSNGGLMIEDGGELWHAPTGAGPESRPNAGRLRRGCATAVGRAALRFSRAPSPKPCARGATQSKAQPILRMDTAHNLCLTQRGVLMKAGERKR